MSNSLSPEADAPPTAVTRQEIVEVFRGLLGRDPESRVVVDQAMRSPTFAEFLRGVVGSAEFNQRRAMERGEKLGLYSMKDAPI